MECLVLNKRENKKSNSSRRREGLVPGIIYGKNIENYLFEVGNLELNKEISEVGEHGILSVDVNGSKLKTLVKEVQREPINNDIIHIDLQKVDENATIQTEVPIVFHNENLVSKKGGILQKEKTSIKVECSAENLPKSIDLDLSNLEVGSVLKMTDVELGEDMIMIEDLDTVIVSVTYASIDKTNKEETILDVEKEE